MSEMVIRKCCFILIVRIVFSNILQSFFYALSINDFRAVVDFASCYKLLCILLLSDKID